MPPTDHQAQRQPGQPERKPAKNPFRYHRPSAEQIVYIEMFRKRCEDMYDHIIKLRDEGLMTGREAALAITNLEQVSMWGNKGIVLADEGPVVPG